MSIFYDISISIIHYDETIHTPYNVIYRIELHPAIPNHTDHIMVLLRHGLAFRRRSMVRHIYINELYIIYTFYNTPLLLLPRKTVEKICFSMIQRAYILVKIRYVFVKKSNFFIYETFSILNKCIFFEF